MLIRRHSLCLISNQFSKQPNIRESYCRLNNSIILRRHLSTKNRELHVCIVGSGPAGFYTAQGLLSRAKKCPDAKVSIDILEKLPVPFGLVRYGVAPDHPEVKNVDKSFERIADQVNFVGNLNVGSSDIRISELRSMYDVVILAYGAAQDKKLEIPGESECKDVISARSFVGFYNGLPEDADLGIDLSQHEDVVIVGVGNVALDVARILLTRPEHLSKTDMTQRSLDVLSKSNVKRVTIVGRRGPLDVSFTIKEFREMLNLGGGKRRGHCIVDPSYFTSVSDEYINKLDRPRKRLTKLIKTVSGEEQGGEGVEDQPSWRLKLFSTPQRINLNSSNQRLESLTVSRNKYDSNFMIENCDQTEEVPCSLLFRSIGYKSVRVEEGLPFDERRGIIPNTNGHVDGERGLFCAGWLATGPRGVIVDTMTHAHFVAGNVWSYLNNHVTSLRTRVVGGHSELSDLLRERGVKTVSLEDWKTIDKLEKDCGAKKGKPREKLLDFKNFTAKSTT